MTQSYLTDRSRLWAKRAAVHYLGRYATSSANLKAKIYQKALRKYEGIEEEEAEALAGVALDFCLENGFLNDITFADSQVSSGVRKGSSRRKIASKLSEKGIQNELASAALENADDLIAAMAYAKRRKIGPWRRVELDIKQKQREMASFARQGFSGGHAYKVMEMDPEEAENLLWDQKTNSTWRHD